MIFVVKPHQQEEHVFDGQLSPQVRVFICEIKNIKIKVMLSSMIYYCTITIIIFYRFN
jgi:hypothetical protein